MSEERVTTCIDCGAPIILIQAVKTDGSLGKRVPLDAEPAGRAMIRFGPNGDKVRFAQTWRSHFATCPSKRSGRV